MIQNVFDRQSILEWPQINKLQETTRRVHEACLVLQDVYLPHASPQLFVRYLTHQLRCASPFKRAKNGHLFSNGFSCTCQTSKHLLSLWPKDQQNDPICLIRAFSVPCIFRQKTPTRTHPIQQMASSCSLIAPNQGQGYQDSGSKTYHLPSGIASQSFSTESRSFCSSLRLSRVG